MVSHSVFCHRRRCRLPIRLSDAIIKDGDTFCCHKCADAWLLERMETPHIDAHNAETRRVLRFQSTLPIQFQRHLAGAVLMAEKQRPVSPCVSSHVVSEEVKRVSTSVGAHLSALGT